MLIIGIDPGKTGAIAYMEYNKIQMTRSKVTVLKMPDTVEKFNDFLQTIKGKQFLIWIEKVYMMNTDTETPGKAVQIQKLFNHVSELKTCMKLNGIQYTEVVPRAWQTRYLHFQKVKKDDRKKWFTAIARERYSEIKINQQQGDAVLIMDYGMGRYRNGQV